MDNDFQEKFKEFYKDDLEVFLNILEEERRKIVKKTKLLFLFSLPFGVSAFYAVLFLAPKIGFEDSDRFMPAIASFLFICVLLPLGYGKRKFTTHRKYFKEKIVKKLFNFLLGDIEYKMDGDFGKKEIKESDLFNNLLDSVKSGDNVTGVIQGIRFQSASAIFECTYEKRPNDKVKIEEKVEEESDGKKLKKRKEKNKGTEDFHGVFLETELSSLYPGSARIVSQGNDKENINRKGGRVTLESSEFSRKFTVYGDQLKVRQTLTPLFMERLLKLQSFLEYPFLLSVVDRQVCIFFMTDQFNMLELRLLSPLNFDTTERYMKTMIKIVNIPMILNTGKEISFTSVDKK